jgi:arabinoxylan arabinofuranohydrolase
MIFSQRYTADPAPLVYNGRVYLYMSHDRSDMTEWSMSDYTCISSDDMVNWTDHGEVFDVRSTPWARVAWAPEITEKDGRFYLYYCCPWVVNGTGVAVANNPLGPFVNKSDTPFVKGQDCSVLKDNDGKYYIFYPADNGDNALGFQLSEDMQSVVGAPIRIPVNHHGEASYITHINGKYQYVYMAFSGGEYWGQKIQCYMISDSIRGPYRNPDDTRESRIFCWPVYGAQNTQAGIFKFHGNYYNVYHSSVLANKYGHGGRFQRNVGVDRFYVNADGTFKLQTITRDGLRQLKYVDPYKRVEAEMIAAQKGIDTKACNDEGGGRCVTNIDVREWTKVKGVDFGVKGASSVSVRVSSKYNNGLIRIHVDSIKGEVIASINIPNTGGEDKWNTLTVPVKVRGIHDLYFEYAFGGFDFNWWQFAGGQTSGDIPPRVVKNIRLTSLCGNSITVSQGIVTVSPKTTTPSLFYLIDNEDGSYSLKTQFQEYVSFNHSGCCLLSKHPYPFTLCCNSDGSYCLRADSVGLWLNIENNQLRACVEKPWNKDLYPTSRFWIEEE